MALRLPDQGTDDTELDVTSFMNLMIVLVPVLLLSMTFASVSVLDIKLPELTGGYSASEAAQASLEVVVLPKAIKVYFPSNTLIGEIPAEKTDEGDTTYDFYALNELMWAVKKKIKSEIEGKEVLQESVATTQKTEKNADLVQTPAAGSPDGESSTPSEGANEGAGNKKDPNDKRDIVIRLHKSINYQSIVATMDAVKSYKTVVVNSVVEYELFPEISLGDVDKS
ncbi:MAG: biopolymer transporter ExbD [Alteromonadaceae bacterium]|nr:MAG: biopolymer transporter ExbD [Alteromonadaceae bacterium]